MIYYNGVDISKIIADPIPGRIQHGNWKRMSLAKMAAYKDAAMTEVWGEQWQHEPGQHQWQQAGGTAAAHSHKDFAKSDVGIVATASSASFGAGCTTNSSLARKMEIMRIILHLEVLPQESRKSWDFGISYVEENFHIWKSAVRLSGPLGRFTSSSKKRLWVSLNLRQHFSQGTLKATCFYI